MRGKKNRSTPILRGVIVLISIYQTRDKPVPNSHHLVENEETRTRGQLVLFCFALGGE